MIAVFKKMKDFNKFTQCLKYMKNSCGKRKGCLIVELPICKIVAIPSELVCDNNESFEKLRKVA